MSQYACFQHLPVLYYYYLFIHLFSAGFKSHRSCKQVNVCSDMEISEENLLFYLKILNSTEVILYSFGIVVTPDAAHMNALWVGLLT